MATNFPASLDTLTNPTSSDSLSSPSHSAQHANVNDAVEALQAKVGADSSAVTSSLDYKVAQLEAISHGKILQVVSTTKTDTFSTTSTSFVDVTGLSVTITPTSATSKVFLILTFGTADTAGTYEWHAQVERDGTPIGVGDSAGSRVPSGISILPAAGNRAHSASWSFLDSPASTSALVYQTQARVGVTGTILINQGGSDSDASRTGRSISTLTAFEVSA